MGLRGAETVWNPKRVLLLGLGFVLFLTGYTVYAYFLGGLDGLPPLPAALAPGETSTLQPPPPSLVDSEVDRKLKLAFGAECPDVHRKIKIEVRKKRVVLASD